MVRESQLLSSGYVMTIPSIYFIATDSIPVLSRAYFFDNSGPQMIYLGQYSREGGFEFGVAADCLPRWFHSLGLQG